MLGTKSLYMQMSNVWNSILVKDIPSIGIMKMMVESTVWPIGPKSPKNFGQNPPNQSVELW